MGSANRLRSTKSSQERELLKRMLNGLRYSGAVVIVKIACTGTNTDEEYLLPDSIRQQFTRTVSDKLTTM